MNSLKLARIEKGLTIRDLEALSGVSFSTISSLENNRQNANGKTIHKLAKALAKPIEFFEDVLITQEVIRARVIKAGSASKGKPKTKSQV